MTISKAPVSAREASVIAIIFGFLVLVAVAPMFLFSYQQTQPVLMRVASAAYTLSLLPAGILSLWWKKPSGLWMIGVALISALALCSDEISRHKPSDGAIYLLSGLVWWIFVASIPAFIGTLILTRRESVSGAPACN